MSESFQPQYPVISPDKLPEPFPIIPIADNLIVYLESSERTGGGILRPVNQAGNSPETVIVRVLAKSPGRYSATGTKLPEEVEIGDLLIAPLIKLMPMSLSLRDELLKRGVPQDEMKNIFGLLIGYVAGKFAPIQPQQQEEYRFER